MLKLLSRALPALALAFAPAALAQTTPAPAPAPESVRATPAMWVVKDKDTTIYLLGTVHVLKPELNWFDGPVKAAFDKSDQVMLEITEPDPATIQGLILQLAFNPTGPSVSDQLPEDKRAAFAKALADAGLPAAGYERLDPWLSAVTLSLGMLPKYGYDPNRGAERVIGAAAKAANKPLAGLETVEGQFKLFDGMTADQQIGMLVKTLDDLPRTAQTLDAMVAAWAAGKPDQLAELMNKELDASPEIAKSLLYDRNANWAQWIKTRLATPGTVFIAVGAGHLAGKLSVQDDLAKLHIKARRVKY